MHADTQVIERRGSKGKDPQRVASGTKSALARKATKVGMPVEQVQAEWLRTQQEARSLAQIRGREEEESKTEAIHEVILLSPEAVRTLGSLMRDPTVPAGVRRLCANDIATLACIQQTVQKRLESNTKDVSEMTAQELDAVIGNLQAARDSLDSPPVGEIVATDPA